ncbi:unnamed protein product [Amoebophrya sp. A25]|nr:unnamed protein product [Amoebophrya sp. A25]|eukprot:GSA25T00005058001.1
MLSILVSLFSSSAASLMLFGAGVSVGFLVYLARHRALRNSHLARRVMVIVIGDVARSPRMMNHASEFAKRGVEVLLVGHYEQGDDVKRRQTLPREIADSSRIHLVPLPQFICPFPWLPYPFYLLWRILYDLFHFAKMAWISMANLSKPPIDSILIQNPPMVPQILLLKACQMLAAAIGSRPKIVVDFHNFGYTILGMKLRKCSPIVKALEFAETNLARICVDSGFSVTKAMRDTLHDIRGKWRLGVDIRVLYDSAKPPADPLVDVSGLWDRLYASGHLDELKEWNDEPRLNGAANGQAALFCAFQNPSLRRDENHTTAHDSKEGEPYTKQRRMAASKNAAGLSEDCRDSGSRWVSCSSSSSDFAKSTQVSEQNGDVVKIISSTSWTPDEDFSDLFHSLTTIAVGMQQGKRLVLFITGKGALRQHWQKYWDDELKNTPIEGLMTEVVDKDNSAKPIKRKLLLKDRIRVVFLFLPWADYPRILQACDFGVCMHQSSSGLDLPMKVVDMFGMAELPVIARNFPALPELVENEKNGYVFSSKEELANRVVEVVNHYADEQHAAYGKMRLHIHDHFVQGEVKWEHAWERELWQMFENSSPKCKSK